jgi:hypothetical protein
VRRIEKGLGLRVLRGRARAGGSGSGLGIWRFGSRARRCSCVGSWRLSVGVGRTRRLLIGRLVSLRSKAVLNSKDAQSYAITEQAFLRTFVSREKLWNYQFCSK